MPLRRTSWGSPISQPPSYRHLLSRASARGLRHRRELKRLLTDFRLFSRYVMRRPLFPYQSEPALAILDSIIHRRGLTITVMMSRQAGKNELSAQLEAFLLIRFQRIETTIVKAAPTFRPQLLTSQSRLVERLDNPLSRGLWTTRLGQLQLNRARILFLSGAPDSRVVGATAAPLLEIDEAQDFGEDKYLRDFRPMCAATNATTVLYGTAWTPDNPLEHARLENRRLEAIDGIQRNFTYPWSVVAEHNAAYRDFVQGEEARMGLDHPFFRTQYLLESLDSAGRLFSATQLSQMETRDPFPAPVLGAPQTTSTSAPASSGGAQPHMSGSAPASSGGAQPHMSGSAPASSGGLGGSPPTELSYSPFPAHGGGGRGERVLIAGIDLAGEDEAAEDSILRSLQPQRDSTAVAIAQVTWETNLRVPEPRVEVIHFEWWTGRKHSDLLPQLVDLLKNVWPCQSVVVDSTGLGAGISSFLVAALGADIVHPFSFSAVSKSALGYQLLSTVNAGRLKIPVHESQLRGPPRGLSSSGGPGGLPPVESSYSPSPEHGGRGQGDGAPLTEFWRQARLARSELRANKRISFYVDPREGHDDLLVAVALAVEAAQHSRPLVATGRLVRRF